MPRPAMPPTPASSADLKGQEQGYHGVTNLQFQTFELPPPAMPGDSASRPTSAEKEPTSPKTPYPVQPSETVKSRRRSSANQPMQAKKEVFALPPPPTRSRKIIQMKPRQEDPAPPPTNVTATKTPGPKKAPSAEVPAPAPGKKKQSIATSAAGRKIARKTAHSLIERRRRSKMNEEFGVLKGLIPACRGEMHKLAILQASIEYIRYLEECVQKLKAQASEEGNAQTHSQTIPPTSQDFSHSPTGLTSQDRIHHASRTFTDASGDVDMTGSEAQSPYSSAPASVHQASVSPSLASEDCRRRNSSYSSMNNDQRHYSYGGPATTSPAFGPRVSAYPLTSPGLVPQQERDLDHEATAALLMLNKAAGGLAPVSQPSGSQSNSESRRMSVRDLLSS